MSRAAIGWALAIAAVAYLTFVAAAGAVAR